tara:strand:- start:67 stop:924 length:858 start_codon:yes stop_codon:yes gene_type:complete
MKEKNIILVLLVFTNYLFSQTTITNEYIFDKSSINPAATALSANSFSLYYNAKLIGVNDAPKTQKIDIQSFVSENTAIGFSIFNQKKGVSGKTAFQFKYAYQLKLNKKLKLSLGLQSAVQSVSFDETALVLGNPEDNAITGELHRDIVPEASGGFALYTTKVNFGFSVVNLFGNEVYSRKVENEAVSFTYISYLDYILSVSDFDFTSSVLVLQAADYPLISQFNLNVKYNKFMIGGAISNSKSVSVISGIQSGKMIFNYIFSTPTSLNNTLVKGGNEIRIQFLLP